MPGSDDSSNCGLSASICPSSNFIWAISVPLVLADHRFNQTSMRLLINCSGAYWETTHCRLQRQTLARFFSFVPPPRHTSKSVRRGMCDCSCFKVSEDRTKGVERDMQKETHGLILSLTDKTVRHKSHPNNSNWRRAWILNTAKSRCWNKRCWELVTCVPCAEMASLFQQLTKMWCTTSNEHVAHVIPWC